MSSMASERVLWSVEKLSYTIGFQTLFSDAEVAVNDGERLALVGRNGTGKSTLLRIIMGLDLPSAGEIRAAKNIFISMMPQIDGACLPKTVEEVVSEGLDRFEKIHSECERLTPGTPEHDRLEQLLNLHDAWNTRPKLDFLLSKLGLDSLRTHRCSELSGGELRKTLLARALISEPDLLLLDEPTNHLDIMSVASMEEFLGSFRGACLFVTHDRYFLDRLATRIVELDNGKFYSCPGSYADFLAAKEAREYAEDQEEARRKSFLRREIEWVRRSPKARLRRNLGRLKRYDETAAKSAPVRASDVELVIPKADYLGNKVVTLKDVSYSIGGRMLLDHFTFEFHAGMKIGVVGANGAGKTTLLNLISGKLQPDSGTIETAETVRFNYIEQEHVQLNPEKSVVDEIANGGQTVNLGGESIGIRAYLKRFLFTDDRINTQIKLLSGGERARLILAKILRGGGNFLILDEPTNDLDLPTLRVLEEALADYTGCLAVVSHDRYFLNRVCTHIMAFEPGRPVFCDLGDYDTYIEKKRLRDSALAEKQPAAPARKAEPVPEKPDAPKKEKMTWKEQRELESLEPHIAKDEARVTELEALFSAPDFFAKHGSEMQALQNEHDSLKTELDSLYSRWDELESKRERCEK